MAAPFTILGIDHVVLRAADPAALERFYMDVLGCAFEKRQGTSSTGGANLDHLCLRVEPFDATAIAHHFAAHGVRCGEEASRYGAEGQGPSVYLHDPEGNGVELKGPVTD